MEPELKTKWVEALRSGEYAQGRAKLRSVSNRYCCLGVLMDIIGTEWTLDQAGGVFYTADGAYGFLRPGTLERVGLLEGSAWELAVFNDDGQSFAEIANYIEANL